MSFDDVTRERAGREAANENGRPRPELGLVRDRLGEGHARAQDGSALALDEVSHAVVRADAIAAAARIAPLWPLHSFVAVNPALGFADAPFANAAGVLADVYGARLVMPRSFYAEAIAVGRVTDAHLEAAIGELGAGAHWDAAGVARSLRAPAPEPTPLATFADFASAATRRDWASLARDRISAWAGAYFDEGQASWRSPWRDLSPYAAWREEALIDRTPEVMGLKGFRAAVSRLPEQAADTIVEAANRLTIPSEARRAYFHRLLATIAGWAGYARGRGWVSELRGGAPAMVMEMLAVRIAWDAVLQDRLHSNAIDAQWREACAAMAAGRDAFGLPLLDQILQLAYEIGYRAPVITALARQAQNAQTSAQAPARPAAQAVFCIDVRSERYRRALERVNPDIATIGFAGFFGAAIEVAPTDCASGHAQCPVLLEPQFVVSEQRHADGRAAADQANRRTKALWKNFATAAVSSFAFVEAAGLAFAGALARSAAKAVGAPKPGAARLSITPDRQGARDIGLAAADRLAVAENALAGMTLTENLARLVVLVGHGAATTNNPHAAGLDCGACGGHSGEANARVAAMILNDPEVRAGLAAKGKPAPEDTVFLAGVHDTTSDAVTLLDLDAVPASHAADLAQLQADLAEASRHVRRERAPTLGLSGAGGVDARIAERGRDWSQVRPEWGLAGCAAFIAAPRARTEGVDLGGRSFLHSYDWRRDTDESILELIMTAPLVVASWISLQYYGSTVDNAVFGSGDKTLHNVVGGVGVLEGNAGDLRVGLPLQSIHDGERFMHEPVRLTALIEAPVEAMNRVLEKHENVRALFDNSWLHLIAIGDEGRTFKRYAGGLAWEDVDVAAAS